MKKQKLDYTFKLKDLEATKNRHIGRIKRLKQAIKEINKQSVYGFGVDWANFQEKVEYVAKDTAFYNYLLLKSDSWVSELSPKKRLRMVKTFINQQTRLMIIRELEARKLPKSWDTAFYILFYKKINSLMKDLVKNYF